MFNKIVAIVLTAYVVISFLPVSRESSKQTEIVTEHHYQKYSSFTKRGSREGNLIFITTNKGNHYEFEGRDLGSRSFAINDTIESVKNLLFKTTGVNHLKYDAYYPINGSNTLLFFLAGLCVVMLIFWLSDEKKNIAGYNMATLIAIVLFLIYVFWQ